MLECIMVFGAVMFVVPGSDGVFGSAREVLNPWAAKSFMIGAGGAMEVRVVGGTFVVDLP